jgi:hypothetical protein
MDGDRPLKLGSFWPCANRAAEEDFKTCSKHHPIKGVIVRMQGCTVD